MDEYFKKNSTLTDISYHCISTINGTCFSTVNQLIINATNATYPNWFLQQFLHPLDLETPNGDVFVILSVLIFLFGLFGNIIVVYVIGYRKKTRNSGDFYLLALAFVDLVMVLQFLLSTLYEVILIQTHNSIFEMTIAEWIAAKCSYRSTITASSWILVLISLDRLR